MTIQLIEATHAPRKFNGTATVETVDFCDVLGQVSALMAYRHRCRKAIAAHSRDGGYELARAHWLTEHERTMAKLAKLAPEAKRLIADVLRETSGFIADAPKTDTGDLTV